VDRPVHVLCTVGEVERLCVKLYRPISIRDATTLSLDDTRDVSRHGGAGFRHHRARAGLTSAYATQNRQNRFRALAADADVLLVVGAQNSSNSTDCGRWEHSRDPLLPDRGRG